ncbi:MAG TPA: hypothetical protein VMS17_25920 [Gemmataceae bacterium]|nr:hypothetical protein [Gemmataceae bacterium]
MNYLTADQPLLERLEGIMEPVEIRGPDGKVLGTFTPALSPEEQEAYRQAAALFDPEELDRIEKEGGPYYTTAEVLAYLESLEKKE